MTGRRFHRTPEVSPCRPWKFLLPDILNKPETQERKGCPRGTTRYFLLSFPSYGPLVVQSYQTPITEARSAGSRHLSGSMLPAALSRCCPEQCLGRQKLGCLGDPEPRNSTVKKFPKHLEGKKTIVDNLARLFLSTLRITI